jgi:hypothetical protein
MKVLANGESRDEPWRIYIDSKGFCHFAGVWFGFAFIRGSKPAGFLTAQKCDGFGDFMVHII